MSREIVFPEKEESRVTALQTMIELGVALKKVIHGGGRKEREEGERGREERIGLTNH